MEIATLTRQRMSAWLDTLIAVSADASPWTAEHFLREMPDKWRLSFAALDSGTPVAYAILSQRCGRVHINQLMVTPQKRGSGLGSLMLHEAMRRNATSLKVAPDNSGAIRFYARHGWQAAATENGYTAMLLDPEAPAVSGPVLGHSGI